MPKIPKYYVRPDGLHESIIKVTMPDGTQKRKAFRGKTDTEVYNKIKNYSREAATHPEGVLFRVEAQAWWKEIEPTLVLLVLFFPVSIYALTPLRSC